MGLLDIWDRVTAPEKAPEKPQGKWIGEVGPDPIRDKPAPPKVQAIDQASFVKSACEQITAFVRSATIPEILKEVEEKMATTTEQKQAFDQMTSTLVLLKPLMEQFIPAVEGQTQKYNTVVQERDSLRAAVAALNAQTDRMNQERAAREAELEKERDQYKAEFEKANGILAAFHQAAANAAKNLAS